MVFAIEKLSFPIPAEKGLCIIFIYIYLFIHMYVYIYINLCIYIYYVFFFFSRIWMDSVLFSTSYTGQALGCPARKYTVPFIVIVIIVFSLCRDVFTQCLAPAIPKSQLHYKQKHSSLSSNHTDKSSISWELIVSQPYWWEKSILNTVNPRGKVPSWHRR